MTISTWLIVAFWLVLVVTWAASWGRARRTISGRRAWLREVTLRLAIVILVLLAFRLPIVSQVLPSLWPYAVNHSPIAGLVGVVLSALGVGVAVLGRLHLGRNWGLPMSRKQEPELVTTGPYAVIRHPIYAGLLLAMLGSAIGQSIFWILPLVVCVPYFIYSARHEENFMTQQFPEHYPAYVKRTRMFLPYVL